MTSTANLRTFTTDDGITFQAALDVCAAILDAATEVEHHPDLAPAAPLRQLAQGLAHIADPPEGTTA